MVFAFSCPMCGDSAVPRATIAGRDRMYQLADDVTVLVCSNCDGGTTTPHVAGSELEALYPQSYYAHISHPTGWAAAITRAYHWARDRRGLRRQPLAELPQAPARVLDVGCGRGDLLSMLRSHGWQTLGVEPDHAAVAEARTRGLEVHSGTLDQAEIAPASVDAVIYSQVAEHLNDPVADFHRAFEALRPGGVLIVSVPNFGCWQRRRFAGRWYGLDLPRHRVHYTEKSLRRTLERAGLLCEQTSQSTDPLGLLASVMYVACGRWVAHGTLAHRALAGLSLALWPLSSMINRVAGSADVLHAVACKPADAF